MRGTRLAVGQYNQKVILHSTVAHEQANDTAGQVVVGFFVVFLH